jgi:hypothetical protein
MKNSIIQQGTEEWLIAKQTTIGGSEIYALVLNLCTLEEIRSVLPNFVPETSFTTAMLCGLKFLYGQTVEMKPAMKNVLRYGNAMEEPSIAWFNQQYRGVANCEFTRDFHYHEKNKNASCSPDGYITLNGTVRDISRDEVITSADGRGVMEIKTVRRQDGFKDEPKMQYIFQACWNAYILNMNWFCLFLSFAKEIELEDDFSQGQRVAYAETNQYEKIFPQLHSKTFFYKLNPGIINLCLKAFGRFLDKIKEAKKLLYTEQWTVFQFSDNQERYYAEKAIVLEICSRAYIEEHGDIEATEEESNLLLRRYELIKEEGKIEKEKNEIQAYFLKKVAKHNSIISYETQTVPEMRFLIKNGKATFSPNFCKKKFKNAFAEKRDVVSKIEKDGVA